MALEKVFQLERLIYDGSLSPDGWGSSRLRFESARLHGRLAQKQSMYEDLKAAAQAAKAFDERPESQSYESVLLGTIEEKALGFETADSRPLKEIMRDKWLSDTALYFAKNTTRPLTVWIVGTDVERGIVFNGKMCYNLNRQTNR